ncbi:hypothetical protein NP554_02360 [Pseudomonas asiatica]|uniref:Uncharacterized protein n=1 Tax=Pseudomonas asiatica TaxID=2219225 RepID=A0A9X4HVK1_9PSED|nr:hypothetical protein [Pseudomonas asiatica]MDD2110645.1 hypothetical protein [Pseudomonas asiatica]
MANRSKKVVLSARIDGYLKAGLEMYAASREQKIVKVLETFLETGLDESYVDSPFHDSKRTLQRITYLDMLKAVWSEDEILFKVRAGALGRDYAGETAYRQAMTAIACFPGEVDLYGDLNGYIKQYGYESPRECLIDLERVRADWHLIEDYVAFLENNKPFEPTFGDYLAMREKSESK